MRPDWSELNGSRRQLISGWQAKMCMMVVLPQRGRENSRNRLGMSPRSVAGQNAALDGVPGEPPVVGRRVDVVQAKRPVQQREPGAAGRATDPERPVRDGTVPA